MAKSSLWPRFLRYNNPNTRARMHNSNSNLPLATWYRSDENYLQDAPHKSWHCAQPKVLNGFRVTLHWKYPDDIILTPHFGKCVFIRVRQGKIPNEQISEATWAHSYHILASRAFGRMSACRVQTTKRIKVITAKCTYNKLFKRQSGETPQLLRAHLHGHATIICARL